jgi:hypothetical protein
MDTLLQAVKAVRRTRAEEEQEVLGDCLAEVRQEGFLGSLFRLLRKEETADFRATRLNLQGSPVEVYLPKTDTELTVAFDFNDQIVVSAKHLTSGQFIPELVRAKVAKPSTVAKAVLALAGKF